MSSELTDQAKRFISRNIRSMSSLEMLLYLRNHGGEENTIAVITSALRGNAEAIADQLEFFESRQLLVHEASGAYRYRPESPSDDAVLTELARAFRERPIALMDAILGAPSQNIQSFADAFRLKGN